MLANVRDQRERQVHSESEGYAQQEENPRPRNQMEGFPMRFKTRRGANEDFFARGRIGVEDRDRLGDLVTHLGDRRGGELAPGDRVMHPVFGIGRLEALSGQGTERRLTIDFESCGRKQLIPGFARLERLP
mgnify:CR=1 FL=1